MVRLFLTFFCFGSARELQVLLFSWSYPVLKIGSLLNSAFCELSKSTCMLSGTSWRPGSFQIYLDVKSSSLCFWRKSMLLCVLCSSFGEPGADLFLPKLRLHPPSHRCPGPLSQRRGPSQGSFLPLLGASRGCGFTLWAGALSPPPLGDHPWVGVSPHLLLGITEMNVAPAGLGLAGLSRPPAFWAQPHRALTTWRKRVGSEPVTNVYYQPFNPKIHSLFFSLLEFYMQLVIRLLC